MGRGRAANYEGQREMILARAAELFARGGYPGTSMNQVAEACGLSKATLYHYYQDKYELLVNIADDHVSRLQGIVRETLAEPLPPEAQMRELVARLVEEYANAQHAHRVLTEDVKFLDTADRERVLDKEREVVRGFAQVVGELRPDLLQAAMTKPLTMLLFGMINWLFTWMKPRGRLDYEAMAPLVADLFLGGLGAVEAPAQLPRQRRA
ncbi:TetR/AcrR family transcriptional regulator [Ramlibacter sp. PS3R-8]|uniref:TetR/AcrR family transcriptional regulator n=1 Tax=Ramlibacter sp. PS3R-8 TaxID=3133437 RepID=UPI0030B2ACE4